MAMSGRTASRVSNPSSTSVPQTISNPPTNGARISGDGRPIWAKRPAPDVGREEKLLSAFRKEDRADHQAHQKDGGGAWELTNRLSISFPSFAGILAIQDFGRQLLKFRAGLGQ